MAKGNNYFNAIPTSDTLDSNSDIPIAETVNAHVASTNDSSPLSGSGGNDDAVPTTSSTNDTIMVEITAPANLHEGYKFDAFFNGVSFPVIVPAGGCRKGQILIVPFNPEASNGTPNAWKDGILACTRYGLCHPSFLCAWCFPLILLGQVMTRLKMDWAGHVSRSPDEWKKTFRTLMLIGIFKFLVFDDQFLLFDNRHEYYGDHPHEFHPLHAALLILYVLYLIYLLTRVRKYIRDRDGIPNDHHFCGKYEDCCMAYFLPCCTVSQLARQTANYDIEIGHFMTQDGLAPPPDLNEYGNNDVDNDESMII